MAREGEMILEEAEFEPRVCVYWLASGAMVCTFTVVGIPLLPLWLIASGQNAAALITLLGVKDSEGFRERVLEQRDRITYRERDAAASAPPAAGGDHDEAQMLAVLKDIRASLERLEKQSAQAATRN